MNKVIPLLTIGEISRRSGVAASALRFYETKGLIDSVRGRGNQRRYERATLRKVAILRVGQTLGLSLAEIENAFEALPNQRSPTKKDWEKLSRRWGKQLDQRIADLQQLRNKLSSCIGCGCLSLKKCGLYNPYDYKGREGNGPRYLGTEK